MLVKRLASNGLIVSYAAMKRIINVKLLNSWLGEKRDGFVFLVQNSGLSFHTIERMKSGQYRSTPTKGTRLALCRLMRIDEDELFPIIGPEAP